ncbi:hypothetical protein [Guptibacillus spartinae]|uniref:hypothetical protein n=1 Tax=Guptibacillus spartinae TaxID=3025679 RepID=UPI00235DCD85|nr:hypothetical protein [Pseudalkalibacillus spartinae]
MKLKTSRNANKLIIMDSDEEFEMKLHYLKKELNQLVLYENGFFGLFGTEYFCLENIEGDLIITTTSEGLMLYIQKLVERFK